MTGENVVMAVTFTYVLITQRLAESVRRVLLRAHCSCLVYNGAN
jgi:hypothetical protein